MERQQHAAAAGAPLPSRVSNAFEERGDAIASPLSSVSNLPPAMLRLLEEELNTHSGEREVKMLLPRAIALSLTSEENASW